jgi:hypothetical protein
VEENKGAESSKDSWMKYTKNNSIEELKTYEETIFLLSAGNNNYPLWANIMKSSDHIIEIEFSTRFRHIKTSHNQENGYPPFKIISTIELMVDRSSICAADDMKSHRNNYCFKERASIHSIVELLENEEEYKNYGGGIWIGSYEKNICIRDNQKRWKIDKSTTLRDLFLNLREYMCFERNSDKCK